MSAKPSLTIKSIMFGLVITAVITSLTTVIGMRSVVGASEAVVAAYAEDLAIVGTLRGTVERESSSARAFLLTGEDAYAEQMSAAREELRVNLRRLEPLAQSPVQHAALVRLRRESLAYESALDRAIASRRAGADAAALRRLFDTELAPARDALSAGVELVARQNEAQLREAEARASTANRRAMALGVTGAALGIFAAAVLAVLLARASREIARRQAELTALVARIQRSNEDLDAFGGRIAHDVRNALGPIAMAAGLLRRPNLADDVRGRTTTILSRSVERTIALVDALLAFSRVGRGPVTEDARGSVRAAVAGVLDEVSPHAADADVSVAADVSDVEVRCPQALLHVIVANLVGNAVKFVRSCERRTVTVASALVDDGCELRIEDSGPGIPESARARIFEPFFRAAGATAPGTGIGLATVQRVVQAHGGKLSVESVVGRGSIFRVWLPLAGATPPALTVAFESGAIPRAQPGLLPRSIPRRSSQR